MAKKKPSTKKKKTAVSKGRGRVLKAGLSLKSARKAAVRSDITADAIGIRGQVVTHVHGALRTLLGHALNQLGEWQGVEARQDDEFYPGQAQQPAAENDPVSTPVATAVELDSGVEKPSPDVPEPLVTDQELAAAKVLLRKIRQMATMAGGRYTVLFYLEELGSLKAFDGRTTDMNKLSGRNFSTTRKRIFELIKEQAVCKDPKSSKIQKIALTTLGKRAYLLHTAATEDCAPN